MADPPAKRSRWGAKEPVAPPNPLQEKLDEVNRLLDGDALPEAEKEILINTRTQLVMKMVAEQQRQLQVDMGLLPPPQPVQMQCKVMLPADSCPGGVQSLVGLVIGARGSTQQLLQEKSGCRVVVRGKGSNKTKAIFGEEEDEETHVLITGPSEEAVQIARKLVETLNLTLTLPLTLFLLLTLTLPLTLPLTLTLTLTLTLALTLALTLTLPLTLTLR